jgi:1,4-dihydroxy-2-naphthoyl-CoA hydrolase
VREQALHHNAWTGTILNHNSYEQHEMSIWKKAASIEGIQKWNANTAAERLGIEFTEMGDSWLSARMPVDSRTVQPYGILHGGASVLLAEALASCAGYLCVDESSYCVGLDINANHIRSANTGWVIGTARPFHIGRSSQVWDIRIVDEADRLICISRLTMAVMARDAVKGEQQSLSPDGRYSMNPELAKP